MPAAEHQGNGAGKRGDLYLASIADRYESHRFLGAATGLVYEQQIDWINTSTPRLQNLDRPVRALDWGCGKGHITYLLQGLGYEVTSCDVLAEVSDSAFGQETPIIDELGIDVVPLDDPVRLPFGDGTFDLVTSFGVLEHVDDDHASLGEIARVLRPGGYFFCSFLPYRWSWTQRVARILGDGYHDRLYTEKSVRSQFAGQGLAVDHLSHGQLFPKNTWRRSQRIEQIDQTLCRSMPLRLIATNLIVLASRTRPDRT